jgi:hypothetical protein
MAALKMGKTKNANDRIEFSSINPMGVFSPASEPLRAAA